MDGSLSLRERRNIAAGKSHIYLRGLLDGGAERFREKNYDAALQYFDQVCTKDRIVN